MAETIRNRYGRQPGRGFRPWLLLPKVIVVAVYLGTLAAVLFIWLSSGFNSLAPADPRRLWVIDLVSVLLRFLAVPALLAAIVLGILLFLQHPRQFIRMRWLQVKLVGLVVLIPAAHLYCSTRMALLREAYAKQVANDRAANELAWGLGLTFLGFVVIVILGRLKPRLGQNWAKTFPTTAASPQRAQS